MTCMLITRQEHGKYLLFLNHRQNVALYTHNPSDTDLTYKTHRQQQKQLPFFNRNIMTTTKIWFCSKVNRDVTKQLKRDKTISDNIDSLYADISRKYALCMILDVHRIFCFRSAFPFCGKILGRILILAAILDKISTPRFQTSNFR